MPQDDKTAIKWITKAADNGNNVAMYKLGCLCLEGGYGVPIQTSTAISWFTKAAELGNTGAMTKLGIMYR